MILKSSLKPTGQAGNSSRVFYGEFLKLNSLSYGQPGMLLLRSTIDWIRLPYIVDGNLLYEKSIDFGVLHKLSWWATLEVPTSQEAMTGGSL